MKAKAQASAAEPWPADAPSPPSAYDLFAEIYSRSMAAEFSRSAVPVIERLVLEQLPPGARVLDLCCGSGETARVLGERGFRVTGLDNSRQMLRLAAAQAPQAELLLADARCFWLPRRFAAALSLFNSMAHMATSAELLMAFSSVRRALLPNGPFLFDLSMEAAYAQRWRGSFAQLEGDYAYDLRPSYDPLGRRARNDITLLRRRSTLGWQRTHIRIEQKCHSPAEIHAALRRAGFSRVRSFDAEHDLQMSGERGRCFFLCE